MNPGGDYGKKELSPALKNRFTEIWCPSIENPDQILRNAIKKQMEFCSQKYMPVQKVFYRYIYAYT